MKAMASRVVATIIIGVVWFAFIVLYLAFSAEALNIWQRVAVFLATGAIATGLIAVLWVKWAMD
jgi:hypothetical protein